MANGNGPPERENEVKGNAPLAWKIAGFLAAALASVASGAISFERGVGRVEEIRKLMNDHLLQPAYHETLSVRTTTLAERVARDRSDLSDRLDRLEAKIDRLLEFERLSAKR